jgi:hypothetical protein
MEIRNMETENNIKWLTPIAVAKHFRISLPTVRDWVNKGLLDGRKLSPRVNRITHSSVERLEKGARG